jgi:DNA-binding NarL/FixJ family response regulator
MQHFSALASRQLPEPRVSHILILDDYVTFADALASRLDAEPGVQALATTTIEKARRVLSERLIDVLLLDINLDGRNGLKFARKAATDYPGMRIVVVTAGEEVSQVVEAVRIDVSGWVPKDEPIEHLVAVVRGALRGETWIPPRLLTRVLAELKSDHGDQGEHDVLLAKLTRRERQVLGFLVAGLNVDAIAGQLCLSRNTIRTHIQNLLVKLDVHSSVAAVAVARRAGLHGPDPALLRPNGDVQRSI